jgi:uncharacterized coiled-coil protein SlyX
MPVIGLGRFAPDYCGAIDHRAARCHTQLRIALIDDLDQQVKEALKRGHRGSSRTLLYFCVLAAVVGISGYVWLNYASLSNLAFGDRSAGIPATDNGKTGVAQTDFEAFKRETAQSLQSLNAAISAQKSELRELADQIAALSAKVDASRNAAPSVSPVGAPAEIKQPAPSASALATAARKRVSAPKTTGPISVGGAPLPPAPRDGQ